MYLLFIFQPQGLWTRNQRHVTVQGAVFSSSARAGGDCSASACGTVGCERRRGTILFLVFVPLVYYCSGYRFKYEGLLETVQCQQF